MNHRSCGRIAEGPQPEQPVRRRGRGLFARLHVADDGGRVEAVAHRTLENGEVGLSLERWLRDSSGSLATWSHDSVGGAVCRAPRVRRDLFERPASRGVGRQQLLEHVLGRKLETKEGRAYSP